MKKLISIALCICLTLAAVFTAVPSFNKANADANTEAQTLLSDYYNEGEYIKRTEIYAADLGVGDVNNFHAKASSRSRKTVYRNGNTDLFMTTDTADGAGYRDVVVGGVKQVERYKVVGGVEVQEGHFYVTEYETIEEWFTDLKEFTAAEYTWTKTGNVYETKVNVDKWVEFIAPMWDAPETVYDFERVTMKNTIEGLTLTLYGRIGEAEETEFAKAKITVPAKGWELVTNVSELAEGTQIVIAAKDYDYALSTTQNNNNRGQTAYEKGQKPSDAVQIITLEAGTTAGTFAFNTGSGYLFAASSSSNYLRTEENLSANSSWNITIAADGTATIVAQGSNTRNTMQYNQTSSLFSCYASA